MVRGLTGVDDRKRVSMSIDIQQYAVCKGKGGQSRHRETQLGAALDAVVSIGRACPSHAHAHAHAHPRPPHRQYMYVD
jgi:hypothetical protein